VHGVGGNFAIPLHPIDCRRPARRSLFSAACAALVQGKVVLRGVPRMREPPIQDLADLALRARCLGAHGGGLSAGHSDRAPSQRRRVAVEASKSSQFLSALMMYRAAREHEVEIQPSVQITCGPTST